MARKHLYDMNVRCNIKEKEFYVRIKRSRLKEKPCFGTGGRQNYVLFCLFFSSNKLKFYHSQENFKAMLKVQEEDRN